MTKVRCLAMTATPFHMIVQCDYPPHPGIHHYSHVDTPMGMIGVNWEDRPREGD